VARVAGRPLVIRYGRFVHLTEEKWLRAERWMMRYSAGGIFFARLLPVVRHLISLPAGAARMNVRTFTWMTLGGSFLWCTVLAWFGARVLADQPRLLDDPAALSHVLRDKLMWFVAAAAILLVLYVLVERTTRRSGATGDERA
jgi:membrane protein DedA with SNARE-associated domain